jgi:hypothetical protein
MREGEAANCCLALPHIPSQLSGDKTVRARLPLSLVVVFSVVGLQGCGAGGVRFVPVTGKVTMDGKPLAKVGVTFIPQAKPGSEIAGDVSSGVTDDNGEYKLTAFVKGGEKEGAQVGKHKVTITQKDVRGEGDRQIIREKIPKKYNIETTLSADVKAGGPPINFELTSR